MQHVAKLPQTHTLVIILRIGGQWVSFNEQELRDVQKFAEEYFAVMEVYDAIQRRFAARSAFIGTIHSINVICESRVQIKQIFIGG